MRKTGRALAYCIMLGLGLFMCAAVAIAVAGWRDNVFKADMLVVLGNRIEANGQPHPRLAARLDRAIELYRANMAPLVFVSGGMGLEGFDEATSMAQYLRDHDVPESAIVRDSLGVDSRATAQNAAAYMQAHNLHSALVVTQFFHVPRSEMALRQAGVCQVGGAHARYTEWRDLYSLAREVVGYAAYFAKGLSMPTPACLPTRP